MSSHKINNSDVCSVSTAHSIAFNELLSVFGLNDYEPLSDKGAMKVSHGASKGEHPQFDPWMSSLALLEAEIPSILYVTAKKR